MNTETKVLTDEQLIQILKFGDSSITMGRAIEQAVLQAYESHLLNLLVDIRFAAGDDGKRMQDELVEHIAALRKDAELYRGLKGVCVTSIDFTGAMQQDDPERWCVLRRKNGTISSFTNDDLDYGVRVAMEKQK